MIAKGLDFANATLVGIINADTGLYLPDYRAGEKAFQLIYQSAGRSGRGKIPGEVVIQSYNTDNAVIKYATKLELKKYYDVCLQERESLDYPPFSWIVKFEVRGTKKNNVENSINRIKDYVSKKSLIIIGSGDYADKIKNKMLDLGFSGAFVVAFYKDTRISMQEALDLQLKINHYE